MFEGLNLLYSSFSGLFCARSNSFDQPLHSLDSGDTRHHGQPTWEPAPTWKNWTTGSMSCVILFILDMVIVNVIVIHFTQNQNAKTSGGTPRTLVPRSWRESVWGGPHNLLWLWELCYAVVCLKVLVWPCRFRLNVSFLDVNVYCEIW